MNITRYLNSKNLKEALTNQRFRRKVMNYIRCNIDYLRRNRVVRSFPTNAVLNTTNLCNLRCKFCEIHYFYKKAEVISGKVFPNQIDTETLTTHREWLQNIISLHLSGATGEPFTNPYILDVIRYLKAYNIKLSMDTNGSLVDENVAEQLVRNRFDELSVSVHAGDSQIYTSLQGGAFDKVVSNLKYLISLKRQMNSNYPRVGINFALNRENAPGLKELMKIAREIGVDSLSLYHYYASRNALENDISFYSDVAGGNQVLKTSYDYAKEIGLAIRPETPLYLSYSGTGGVGDAMSVRQCNAPWTAIKFKGCVEYENCEYLGVCNRILLLRMDYKKFYENEEGSFLKYIWNHPVLQFLRETVNSEESNPICRFCRYSETPIIRCLDNVEYSRRRDRAVRDFFTRFRGRYDYQEVEELTVLTENPYEYD
ncbi:radical SAM protein, partial [Chloroflexota bacterium]